MYRKSEGIAANKPAETEFGGDPILVAWIKTTAIEDQNKDHDNRGTLYRMFDIRQDPILVAWIQTTAIEDQLQGP